VLCRFRWPYPDHVGTRDAKRPPSRLPVDRKTRAPFVPSDRPLRRLTAFIPDGTIGVKLNGPPGVKTHQHFEEHLHRTVGKGVLQLFDSFRLAAPVSLTNMPDGLGARHFGRWRRLGWHRASAGAPQKGCGGRAVR
jgi:hypothetical protein